MSTHLTREDAARWTSGVLEDEAARALEAHVATCRACEALLQAEARVEVQLADAVRAPAAVVPLASRRRGVVALAAASLALAASLWFVLSRPPPPPPPPLVAAVDAGAPVADDFDVPRYEEGALVPPEALSAFQPFEL